MKTIKLISSSDNTLSITFDDINYILSSIDLGTATQKFTTVEASVGSKYVTSHLEPRKISLQGYILFPDATDSSSMEEAKTLLLNICKLYDYFILEIDGKKLDVYLESTIQIDKDAVYNSDKLCHFTIKGTALEPRFYELCKVEDDALKTESGAIVGSLHSGAINFTSNLGVYYPHIILSYDYTSVGVKYISVNKGDDELRFDMTVAAPAAFTLDIDFYKHSINTSLPSSMYDIDIYSKFFHLEENDTLNIEGKTPISATHVGRLYYMGGF